MLNPHTVRLVPGIIFLQGLQHTLSKPNPGIPWGLQAFASKAEGLASRPGSFHHELFAFRFARLAQRTYILMRYAKSIGLMAGSHAVQAPLHHIIKPGYS